MPCGAGRDPPDRFVAGHQVVISANGSMNGPLGVPKGFSLDNADVEIRKEVNAVSRWPYNDMIGKTRTDGQAVYQFPACCSSSD